MTDSDRYQQLQNLLASTLIRDREAGIKLAAELLSTQDHSEEVRTLLEKVAAGDPITMVREHAEVTIQIDDARSVTIPPRLADAAFRARCPQGHVHVYDKREVCLGTVKSNTGLDRVQLHCPEPGCTEKFTVEVDCEGYR